MTDSVVPQHNTPEPIAIVGIAGLYPGARGVEDLWTLLGSRHPPTPARTGDGLADVDVDLARFRIPPVQRGSMTRLQVLMLEAARQCLADAGYATKPLPADRTDVVVGTCYGLDRQYANALRVAGARYARDVERAAAGDPDDRTRAASEQLSAAVRARLINRLGASPHDRVGEMASTIPARIAAAFRFLGHTIALESADATSFVALEHAVNSLRANASDAVLVVTGQRREGPLAADLCAALSTAAGVPFPMAEGVGALLLKRRSSAVRAGDRVYASVLDIVLRRAPCHGVLRYSATAEQQYRVARECHDAVGVAPAAVGYLEYVGPGARVEIEGLRRLFSAATASVTLGSARDRLGHTFANAGLASIVKTALALSRGTVPPQLPQDLDLADTPFRIAAEAERWPVGPESALPHAAVVGSALGGTVSYVLLQGHEPGRTIAAPRTPRVDEPIAIVGFGGAFAGAPDAPSCWRSVSSGRDNLGPLPESVLNRELYYAPGGITLTHSYCEVGGPVPIPERPPASLRIPPRRYQAMDPAQRLALSVADEALTRSGRLAALRGRPGLVVIGSTLSLLTDRACHTERSGDELEAAAATVDALAQLSAAARERVLAGARPSAGTPPGPLSPMAADGCLASGIAAHIANEYRLAAIPMAVETACASTLAAIDIAVTALRLGRVAFAIVGGVELACNPRDLVLCSALGMLSPTKITPFAAAADGFSPGEGCAVFLLERRSDARRDGAEIFGLIRSVGGSNDAKSLIAPDVDGQVRAMRRAFEQVEFDPAAVDYLEAHGAGTRVGDRVEMNAAASVYAKPQRARPLLLGSAKSVFGHTYAAAGGAGLLQALHAILARTFPPVANFDTPNPQLPLGEIPAVVPTVATPWPATPGQPRRAGVSSFGTGGINYHLLLEEYQEGGAR